MTRLRLKVSQSQWKDRDRDWKNQSLNDETVQKMSIPRGEWSMCHEMNSVWYGFSDNCQIGWSGFFLNYRANSDIPTRNKWINLSSWEVSFCLVFLGLMTQWDLAILWMLRLGYIFDVKTETHQNREISLMSRPRLDNFLDVETETHRHWEICWM